MTQECVAGLAGGNVERTSFICKLRHELEARKHSKSGISQGHLKSFFYLLFASIFTQRKFCFHPLRRELLAWSIGKKKRKKLKLFFYMQYSIL